MSGLSLEAHTKLDIILATLRETSCLSTIPSHHGSGGDWKGAFWLSEMRYTEAES